MLTHESTQDGPKAKKRFPSIIIILKKSKLPLNDLNSTLTVKYLSYLQRLNIFLSLILYYYRRRVFFQMVKQNISVNSTKQACLSETTDLLLRPFLKFEKELNPVICLPFIEATAGKKSQRNEDYIKLSTCHFSSSMSRVITLMARVFIYKQSFYVSK